ncbi:MAG: phospholipase D family protein [Actinomycetota bacterium]
MLEPATRRLLLEALRPPHGYGLDLAVASTFTLDLHALLTAPLAFAMFDWEVEEERPEASVIASLEAVRRHAERVHIFCQAGEIAVPADYRTLVGYVEDSVHEVRMPPGAIFHPKLWVLRFRRPVGGDVAHRVICLSRNLTFDRSWDTVLSLDGEPNGRSVTSSAPLQEFVRSLPDRAVRALPEDATAAIGALADELGAIEFSPPEGFDRVSFHPLGPGFYPTAPFLNGKVDRLLAISPFLTATASGQIARTAKEAVLISRPESLDALGAAALAGYAHTYVLSSDAIGPSLEEESAPEVTSEVAVQAPSTELDGLHAKIYVVDRGGRAHVWSGSANATDAGLHANVEFLVGLAGPIEVCGVEAAIGERDKEIGLLSLLVPYSPPPDPTPPDDHDEALEQLDELARTIASQALTANVDRDESGDAFRLTLTSEHSIPALPKGVGLRLWPIALKGGRSQPAASGAPLAGSFSALEVEHLTPFFAFEIEQSARHARRRFVVNARLVGAPADRKDRILAGLIRSGDDFLLYLRFLLADLSDAQGLLNDVQREGKAEWGFNGGGGEALLEPMVRALARNPSRLDDIARLVDDMSKTSEGKGRIPAAFSEVWESLWAIRREFEK